MIKEPSIWDLFGFYFHYAIPTVTSHNSGSYGLIVVPERPSQSVFLWRRNNYQHVRANRDQLLSFSICNLTGRISSVCTNSQIIYTQPPRFRGKLAVVHLLRPWIHFTISEESVVVCRVPYTHSQPGILLINAIDNTRLGLTSLHWAHAR